MGWQVPGKERRAAWPRTRQTAQHGEGEELNLRKHAANIIDSLILASSIILEVGNGGPVGRLVLGDNCRGAVGRNQSVVVGSLAETYT